jgi:tetratricopeptide (TPR) repeat protein
MAMKKRERAKGSPGKSGPGTREKTHTRPVEAAPRSVPAVPPAITSREPQKIPVILSTSYGKTAPAGQEKKPAMAKKQSAATEGDDFPMIRRELFENLSQEKESGMAGAEAVPQHTGSSPIMELHPNAYEEKICRYRESLDTNPGDPELWGSIGDLSMKTGKYMQAMEAYERALELDEGNTMIWASLGNALKKTGAYDEAEAAYDRALERDPGQGHVWVNKAKTLAMLGRHEDAIHACRQAILIDETDIDAWMYKGFLLKKISRHSDALNAYDHVLAINPHHDQAIRQRRTLSNGV